MFNTIDKNAQKYGVIHVNHHEILMIGVHLKKVRNYHICV